MESLWIRGLCLAAQGQTDNALDDIWEAIQYAESSDYPQEHTDYMRGITSKGFSPRAKAAERIEPGSSFRRETPPSISGVFLSGRIKLG